MDAITLNKFEDSLAKNKLLDLVKEMQTNGMQQVEIYFEFEQFRAQLREQNREVEEEEVMNVMDVIWYGPLNLYHIFPETLTSQEVDDYSKKM